MYIVSVVLPVDKIVIVQSGCMYNPNLAAVQFSIEALWPAKFVSSHLTWDEIKLD